METVDTEALARFFTESRGEILAEWERLARTIAPARRLGTPALADQVPPLLDRIAARIEGRADESEASKDDATRHALHRRDEGFDLTQVVQEYGVLRECMLRYWLEHGSQRVPDSGVVCELVNRTIDEAITGSVERFTRARDRTLQAIDRIAAGALERCALGDLLRALLAVFVETTASCDVAALFLREGSRFRIRAAIGLDEDLADGFAVEVGEGIPGWVARTAAPVAIEHAAANPMTMMPGIRRRGVRALYAVPLLRGDTVVGVVWMGSLTAYQFSEQDRRLLSTLAARATLAIEHHQLREGVEERAAEVRRSRDQLEVILGGVSEGIIAQDGDGRLLFANEAAARTNGFDTPAELYAATKEEIWSRFDILDEDGNVLEKTNLPIERARRSGQRTEGLVRYRLRSTGAMHWIVASATPVLDGDGRLQMVIGIWRDITDRRRREIGEAFLADATRLLSESLDYEATLARITRLAVPSIADWMAVDLVDAGGALNRVSVAHADPAKADCVEEFRRRFPLDPRAPRGVANVLRTGAAEMMSEVPDSMLVEYSQGRPPGYLDMLRHLGFRSYMCVPMHGHNRILGAVTFVCDASGRRFEENDLALAEDLGRRAAIALENAQLYQEASAARSENARLLRESEEANQRKDEFIAMLGHELRNPLAPMMHAAELLRVQSSGPQRVVDVLDRQVRHLSRLVDDLLEVSRITRGKITLRQEKLDVVGVLRESLQERVEAAKAAGLVLRAELPDRPIFVHGDRTRIAQVLTNLLANAIKFTERGEIALSVTEHPADQEVEIVVRDTGIGIEAELLPRIFEPFIQSDRSLDRSRGGLGLGLAVVKALVALHGGTVGVRSAGHGKGSTFWVRLPMVVEPAARAELPQAPAGGHGRRILVVEDNRDAADMLREVLVELGHEVAVHYSGGGAVELVREIRPDLVLCDLGLPEKDGFQVAGEIRGEGDPPRLVAISGYGMPEDRERSRAAGFDRHLTKPVDAATLQRVIEELAPARGPVHP